MVLSRQRRVASSMAALAVTPLCQPFGVSSAPGSLPARVLRGRRFLVLGRSRFAQRHSLCQAWYENGYTKRPVQVSESTAREQTAGSGTRGDEQRLQLSKQVYQPI